WIGTTLQSVSAQTRQADEIIVIDDGSTDRSIFEIEKANGRAKLLRVNFRNAAAARKKGIEVAEGDWIALLDADDVWYPNHLARATELLEQSTAVALMSNHDWIGLNNELLPMPIESQCKLAAPQSGMNVEDFYRIRRSGF